MQPIYLDHAAATPVDPAVLEAMMPYFGGQFYNPSAMYNSARGVRSALERSRSDIAAILGCRPAEIIFTAGASEANNLAIHGVMEQYPGSTVIVSSIEHDAVLQPAAIYDCQTLPVDAQGVARIGELAGLITDQTTLVSLMYANNEIGSIQPVKQAAAIIAEIRRDRHKRGITLPLLLHTDAAQAANYLDLSVSRLGIDLLSLNGGKIYGPKQSGLLYVRAGLQLQPLIRGGGQESGLRSGTENVAFAVGLANALQSAQSGRASESRRLQELQSWFFDNLAKTFSEAIINGSLTKRLPNNLHFSLPGQDNERLLFALDERGVQAAAGSACAAASGAASHVLAAIGLDDQTARSSVRLTMGRSTTKADLERTLSALQQAIAA